MSSRPTTFIAALVLSACSSTRPSEPCVASLEVCNGADDDCDGAIDNDPTPCNFANARGACRNGECTLLRCAAGYEDCNGDGDDGCEAYLGSLSDCGGCAKQCALDHAREACVDGTCALVLCEAGYENCDSLASNGCEARLDTPANCLSCGNNCALPHAGSRCGDDGCELAGCDPGYFDCDGEAATGCESQRRELDNCGACNTPCAFRDATASCETGSCTFVACRPGFFDCDGTTATGCESAVPCAPPDFVNLQFSVGTGEATCDITTIFECYLRATGFPGTTASAPMVAHSSYTEVTLEAEVTDPQSTDLMNDITRVETRFTQPYHTNEQRYLHRDDGGAVPTLVNQGDPQPANCTKNDGDGSCSCFFAKFEVNSNDVTAGDDVYTRHLAFVSNASPSLFVGDCIMRGRHEAVVRTEYRTTNTLHVEAEDRAGNVVAWQPDPQVTTGDWTSDCTGDACGCCLAEGQSTGDISMCRGLPGMVASNAPNGICIDYL